MKRITALLIGLTVAATLAFTTSAKASGGVASAAVSAAARGAAGGKSLVNSRSALWGKASDGIHGFAAADLPVDHATVLRGSQQLNGIADDIVTASDMNVAVEDDPVEWARLAGPQSDQVLGFVEFLAPPSPYYHAILLSPQTYQAWQSWLSSGSPAGNEYPFAVAALTLIHESYHWKLMSGDESAVNACAIRDFGYWIAKDFNVPATIPETITQQVPHSVIRAVPTTKVVTVKKQVKLNGKWVVRKVRQRVRTYVTKTVTTYTTQTSQTTAANPEYQTLVADAHSFYASQPPPYNAGSCPAPLPGVTLPPPPSAPPPSSAALYHVRGCWTQYTGGSWGNANPASASTSFSGSDILRSGGTSFWNIVLLDGRPTTTFTGTTATLIEPNGRTFFTETLPQPWTPSDDRWETDFMWHWSDDNSLFFQHPERSGSGTWTVRWNFPDGESCSTSFTVS
jgi:hypothetical protein